MHFVLASASPRRLALLAQIGVGADVCPSNFVEIEGVSSSAQEVVRTNALGKGRKVLQTLQKSDVVIAADTVVVLDEKILGKPKDAAEARKMLQLLSGRKHKVMTGVAVFYDEKELVDVVTTVVSFRQLTDTEIESYVATGEPLDKAGAYGIQGYGALLVDTIDGCYSNVVGLPLTRLYQMLAALEVKLF